MKNNFTKAEKVVSKKIIDALFQKQSASFFAFPFKASLVLLSNQTVPAQILIVVPKRNFKYAVARNLIKRQMRELYRLNKLPLIFFLNEKQLQVAISLSYVSQKNLDFKASEQAIQKILDLIIKYFEKNNHISTIGID